MRTAREMTTKDSEEIQRQMDTWRIVSLLAYGGDKNPQLYAQQKAKLTSQSNLPYLMNIIEDGDEDFKVRKEAVSLFKGSNDMDTIISLGSIAEDERVDIDIRMEILKALNWSEFE